MVYMLTFTINIPQMLAIPYIDPMGYLFFGLPRKNGLHRTTHPRTQRWPPGMGLFRAPGFCASRSKWFISHIDLVIFQINIYIYIHSWGVIYYFLPTIPWDAQVVHQFPCPSHRLRKLKSWVEVSRPPVTRRFGRDMALSLGIKPGPTDTAWGSLGTGVTPKHPWFASGYIRILRSNMLKISFFLEHKLT